MTGVLIKRGNLDTDMYTRRTPCKHEAEIEMMHLISQRLPENHQKLGERHGTDSSSPSRGANPADNLISDY